jgi:hypothetical protein
VNVEHYNDDSATECILSAHNSQQNKIVITIMVPCYMLLCNMRILCSVVSSFIFATGILYSIAKDIALGVTRRSKANSSVGDSNTLF